MNKKLISLFFRYFLLVLVGFNLGIISFFIEPFTTHLLNSLLQIFFDFSFENSSIVFGSYELFLIESCFAISAFYLFLVLLLSTPNINLRRRFVFFLSGTLVLALLNAFRIFFLIFILINYASLFSFTHFLFWNLISTILVVGIWFAEVKIFKIRDIPFYTDLKYIYELKKRK